MPKSLEWRCRSSRGICEVREYGDRIGRNNTPAGAREERRSDFECELVVVIGKECKDVSREHALEYVAGYMCGNDVSPRDWQLKNGGSQWCRGRRFDTLRRSDLAW